MIFKEALMSDNRNYRYELTRVWKPKKPKILFIGLNPSTADETADDPTIRKLTTFAKKWGYGGFVIINVFALRSTNWRNLLHTLDPIGPSNEMTLKSWAYLCKVRGMKVVFMWGRNAIRVNQIWVKKVKQLFRENEVECFELTLNKSPKHPLFLSANTKPIKWLF